MTSISDAMPVRSPASRILHASCCSCRLALPTARAKGRRSTSRSTWRASAASTATIRRQPDSPNTRRARKLMAEDANAAIRGAFEGGATDVLVNDSHGGQRNLLPEDLDPRARLISHSFKRHGMMEGLDEIVRCRDLRRLSRQGRRAAWALRSHRIGRRPRSADQRPIGRRRRHERGAGRVVRRARRGR